MRTVATNRLYPHSRLILYPTQVVYREPWLLPESVFKPRVKEADCKDFWDKETTTSKMFERDWARACAKEKFSGSLFALWVRLKESNQAFDGAS